MEVMLKMTEKRQDAEYNKTMNGDKNSGSFKDK